MKPTVKYATLLVFFWCANLSHFLAQAQDAKTQGHVAQSNLTDGFSEKVSDQTLTVPNTAGLRIWLGLGVAVVWILFWIYVFEKREHLSPSRWAMLRIFTSVCIGLIGALFTGEVLFKFQTQSVVISATAGFAIALIVFYFFPKCPESQNGYLNDPPRSDTDTGQQSHRRGHSTMKKHSQSSGLSKRSRSMFNRLYPELVEKYLNQYVAVGAEGFIAANGDEVELKKELQDRPDFDFLEIKKVEVEVIEGFDFGGPATLKPFSVGGRTR